MSDVPGIDEVPGIDVVAGIIFDQSGRQVLLALRRPEQHQGNRWEFPGGKIEAGESTDAALVRELAEEIGIVPLRWHLRLALAHTYPEKRVRLHFMDVTEFSEEPIGREGQTLRWFQLEALSTLRFPEANLAVVDDLLNRR